MLLNKYKYLRPLYDNRAVIFLETQTSEFFITISIANVFSTISDGPCKAVQELNNHIISPQKG